MKQFLYLLLRDHITFGQAEIIMEDVRKSSGAAEHTYEGKNLEAYVEELRAEILAHDCV